MKRLILLSATLCLMALPLHAQNVWTVKIDTFGNFVKSSFNPDANGIVSVFTPATSITVNRIQLQSPSGTLGCTTRTGIKLTDGTTSVSLSIPNTTATGGNTGPVYNDTGVISYTYPAGDELRVVAVPGVGCTQNAYEVSINVQYSIN